MIFGPPFVKRFAQCYRSVVLSCLVLSVCNVRALWPNGWTDQDETWHAGRPRPWPHCVRWGPSSLAQFSAHICCGQVAACIKMPLGMELGLSPGDFVLDGDPALPSTKRGQSPLPIFGPFLLWPNGWMHQDATWYGSKSQDGDSARPLNFQPMFIIVTVISLEHCTVVTDLFNFRFKF